MSIVFSGLSGNYGINGIGYNKKTQSSNKSKSNQNETNFSFEQSNLDENVNPSGSSVANSYDAFQNASHTTNNLLIYVSKPIYEDENYIVYGPAYNPQGILSDKILVNNKKDGSVIFFENLSNPAQFTESLQSYMKENKLNFAQLEKHIIDDKFNSLKTDNLFYDFIKSVGEVQIKRKEYTTIVDNYD